MKGRRLVDRALGVSPASEEGRFGSHEKLAGEDTS